MSASRDQSGPVSELAFWRGEARLTQKQLADKAGIHEKMLQRLERKEIVNPGIRPYVQLADALGIPLEALLEPEWRRPHKGQRVARGLPRDSRRRPLS